MSPALPYIWTGASLGATVERFEFAIDIATSEPFPHAADTQVLYTVRQVLADFAVCDCKALCDVKLGKIKGNGGKLQSKAIASSV